MLELVNNIEREGFKRAYARIERQIESEKQAQVVEFEVVLTDAQYRKLKPTIDRLGGTLALVEA